jgi:hypothetical protein
MFGQFETIYPDRRFKGLPFVQLIDSVKWLLRVGIRPLPGVGQYPPTSGQFVSPISCIGSPPRHGSRRTEIFFAWLVQLRIGARGHEDRESESGARNPCSHIEGGVTRIPGGIVPGESRNRVPPGSEEDRQGSPRSMRAIEPDCGFHRGRATFTKSVSVAVIVGATIHLQKNDMWKMSMITDVKRP